ncbi:hypothetical protein R6Q57_024601 [Mikania cordata]
MSTMLSTILFFSFENNKKNGKCSIEHENVTKLVIVTLQDRVEEGRGFSNAKKDPMTSKELNEDPGMFSTDSYSTVRGVDKPILVNVYLPLLAGRSIHTGNFDQGFLYQPPSTSEISHETFFKYKSSISSHELDMLIHISLGFDYQRIETLQIKPQDWHSIVVILYVYGYNSLRSQCAYDVAPGGILMSVYHLSSIEYGVDQPEELFYVPILTFSTTGGVTTSFGMLGISSLLNPMPTLPLQELLNIVCLIIAKFDVTIEGRMFELVPQ